MLRNENNTSSNNTSSNGPPQNLILAGLPADEWATLRNKLHAVALEQGQVLFEAGEPAEFVYFVEQGMVSVVSDMQNGDSIEVGTIRIEGMAGKWVILDAESVPYRHIMQVPGSSLRMTANALAAELVPGKQLTRSLHRFYAAFNTQVMQGMACNGLHSIEQRCCRWLLTTQDRIGSPELNITHEFLAQMLGVRRASVTEVLRPLQSDGLIRASRGKVVILDSKRLADASCECYGVIRREYQRLMG